MTIQTKEFTLTQRDISVVENGLRYRFSNYLPMKKTVGLALLVFGVIVVGGYLYTAFVVFRCDAEEKAAFLEFPHYGGVRLAPINNEGMCWANFTTPDAPGQVLQYYETQLVAHGWSKNPESDIPESGVYVRNGFSYDVTYESFEGKDTLVAINVYRWRND